MDRTLFTSPMIETFRVCRRAYELAFGSQPVDKIRITGLCKQFILRAIAEVHRGRVTSLPAVQKYLGEHWPAERLAASGDTEQQELAVKAFRFVYRILTKYVSAPYQPKGSEVVGVAQKVRARVRDLNKVYIEEVFDLILWHPDKATLEIVDFHMKPIPAFDPAWPNNELLMRYYAAQRLRSRWPARRVVFTFCHLHTDGITPVSVELEEAVVRLHWSEVVKTLAEMKKPADFAPNPGPACKRCKFAVECVAMDQQHDHMESVNVSLSA